MIFLASPYGHPDPHVREARYRAAALATADLIRQGRVVYSPVVYSHPLARDFRLPDDFAFWRDHSLGMLAAAQRLIVLQLDGWEESKGVTEETLSATYMGKHIEYMPAPVIPERYTPEPFDMFEP